MCACLLEANIKLIFWPLAISCPKSKVKKPNTELQDLAHFPHFEQLHSLTSLQAWSRQLFPHLLALVQWDPWSKATLALHFQAYLGVCSPLLGKEPVSLPQFSSLKLPLQRGHID